MVSTLSNQFDCQCPTQLSTLLRQECFLVRDAYRMGSLVGIQVRDEICPQSPFINLSNPGNGPIRLRMFEACVIPQCRPRMNLLARHLKAIRHCDDVPDHPGLGEIVFPNRLEETVVPIHEFLPQPSAHRPLLADQISRLVES